MTRAPRHLRALRGGAARDPDEPPHRRPPGWQASARAHPAFVVILGVILLVLLGALGWLLHTRQRYLREDARIRAAMSQVERDRADAVLARESSRLQRMRLEVELLRRQASLDAELHLAVSLDSGAMHFEREGALLRAMPVQVGPERRVGIAPDTVHMAAPRGTRLIERILGPEDAWEVPAWVYRDRRLDPPADSTGRVMKGGLGPAAVVLTGGTVIYSMPSIGPLNDSAYVMPGSIRARAEDLQAVLPSLHRGLKVYLY